MVLVVDPWHWLTADGDFLVDNARLYRRMLRIARFIEYGGQLQKNQTREAGGGLSWTWRSRSSGRCDVRRLGSATFRVSGIAYLSGDESLDGTQLQSERLKRLRVDGHGLVARLGGARAGRPSQDMSVRSAARASAFVGRAVLSAMGRSGATASGSRCGTSGAFCGFL